MSDLSVIPLCVPNLEDENGLEARTVNQCFENGMVSYGGAFVNEFQEKVASACGARHAAATSSGTTALHAGLHALGVQPGDLVIVPSLTFIASANAISQCAAEPWLCDVARDSWTLEAAQLEKMLENECMRDSAGVLRRRPSSQDEAKGSEGARIGAIMPVYMLGLPAEMDRICDVARKFDIPVIADGAAAMGATFRGHPIGSIPDGPQLTALSFNANKIITTGGGGMLIGNDEALMERIVQLTTTARDWHRGYHHTEIAFNYRLTNLCAALGVAQMSKLDGFLAAKHAISQRYAQAFAGRADLQPFPEVEWATGACWFSGVFLPEWSADQVTAMRAHLDRHAIRTPPFWKPLHLQPPYRDAPRMDLSVSDAIWQHILPLPCSTHLTVEDQKRVTDAVLSFERQG